MPAHTMQPANDDGQDSLLAATHQAHKHAASSSDSTEASARERNSGSPRDGGKSKHRAKTVPPKATAAPVAAPVAVEPIPAQVAVKPKSMRIPPNARFPSSWTGDLTTSTRQEVADELLEEIQNLMDGTWKDCITRDRYTCGTGDAEIMKYEVVQVLRNQNPFTWCDYVRKRAAMRADLKTKPPIKAFRPKTGPYVSKLRQPDHPLYSADNEMFLFHGTKPSAADSICDNHFLPSGSGALFGPGCYFAEMSSKSDEYVVDDVDGIYQGLYATLLCRVMMGHVRYNDDKKPDGDACANACANRNYNSVVGDREKVRGTYREFIVYDARQAYPEYIIIYRRTKGDPEPAAEAVATPAPAHQPSKPLANPSGKSTKHVGSNEEKNSSNSPKHKASGARSGKKPDAHTPVVAVPANPSAPHRGAKTTTVAIASPSRGGRKKQTANTEGGKSQEKPRRAKSAKRKNND